MKLNINQPCTILVPCKDSSLCSRYYHLLQSSDGVQIVMGSFTFHVCYVTVKRNDDLVRLQSGLFSQVDMKDSLFNDSKNKNNGVYVLPTTNDDIEVLLTWKDVLNGKNTGIQVWITKQYIRDPYPLFYANRKNVIRMDSILFNLVHEVYYDLHQMQFIYNSYLRAMSNCKQAKIKGLESKVEKLDSMLDLKLDGSVFDTFLLKIDSTFKDAIESCYNTFTAISEPIVSDEIIKSLIVEYKSLFPSHYLSMLRHLRYDTKVNLSKVQHLTDNNILYYDRIVFNQFLVQARIANSKQLKHWSSVIQASFYSQDIISNTTHNMGSYFGFSCSYTTLYKLFKEWKGDILANINRRCKEENTIVATQTIY
jgi:hypothetical protein